MTTFTESQTMKAEAKRLRARAAIADAKAVLCELDALAAAPLPDVNAVIHLAYKLSQLHDEILVGIVESMALPEQKNKTEVKEVCLGRC